MADRVVFPDAIDFVRLINDNVVDNALGKRGSYVLLPSLYNRAYALVHETGEFAVTLNVIAPDESTTSNKSTRIKIITSDT